MDANEKPCPFCGESIKKIAILCKHCKSNLKENVNISESTSSLECVDELDRIKKVREVTGASYLDARAIVRNEVNNPNTSNQTDNQSNFNSGISSIFTLILVSAFIFLFITNPTKKDFVDFAWGEISNNNADNELLKETGFIGSGIIKTGINLFTTHNNFLFFSTFDVNTSAIDFFTGESTSIKFIGAGGLFFPFGSHGFGEKSPTSSISTTSSSNQVVPESNSSSASRNFSSITNSEKSLPNALKKKISDHFNSEVWSQVLLIDINSDGKIDAIISGPPDYCGSTGLCNHIAFISNNSEYLFFDLGSIYEIEYESGSGQIFVSTHGSECNLPGNRPCQYEIFWDGSKLSRKY